MTIAISTSVLALVVVSLLFLLFVTAFCWRAGLFDGPDPYGIGWLFGFMFYVCGWVVPSLVAWAAWATWFRSAA